MTGPWWPSEHNPLQVWILCLCEPKGRLHTVNCVTYRYKYISFFEHLNITFPCIILVLVYTDANLYSVGSYIQQFVNEIYRLTITRVQGFNSSVKYLLYFSCAGSSLPLLPLHLTLKFTDHCHHNVAIFM